MDKRVGLMRYSNCLNENKIVNSNFKDISERLFTLICAQNKFQAFFQVLIPCH